MFITPNSTVFCAASLLTYPDDGGLDGDHAAADDEDDLDDAPLGQCFIGIAKAVSFA